MVGRTARRLALQEHRALDTRSLAMEARWMLETCMLTGLESSCPQVPEGSLQGGTPVGVNEIVIVLNPRG
jgi:hypothetical protein